MTGFTSAVKQMLYFFGFFCYFVIASAKQNTDLKPAYMASQKCKNNTLVVSVISPAKQMNQQILCFVAVKNYRVIFHPIINKFNKDD